MTEELLAARLQVAFGLATGWDETSRRRLSYRLSQIEPDADREVHQFRALQQAIRECPALAAALDTAGFTNLAERDTRRVDLETGAWIQAFNRLVDARWKP